MKMKNRLAEKFPATTFVEYSCRKIFIADFSRRTSKKRGVEIADNIWKCPQNPNTDMDVLTVYNPNGCDITFSIFNDHSFKKKDGVSDDSHTEGVFFIDKEDDTFVALYEIKDCKIKKMSGYKNDVKNKILRTAFHLRNKSIVSEAKVIVAYISFPRRKASFNDYLFNSSIEMKKFFVENRVNAYATNNICVSSNNTCTPL